MNSVCSWLRLTMEHEGMFNGVLPTLDLVIWVSMDNKVLYKFFEKEMVSPMVLHKRSAMPEGVRRATLNQEMVRRMVNTSEDAKIEDRLKVVDDYTQKLINSEYDLEEARGIVIGGLKGYERLLSLSRDKSNPKWRPLHMAGSWNSRNRRMAKLRSKENWYKGRQEVDPPEEQLSDKDGNQESSRRMDTSRAEGDQEETVLADQSDSSNRMETGEDQPDHTSSRMDGKGGQQEMGQAERGSSRRMENKNKKRGKGRQTLTLGGKKKMEDNLKRKMKQKLNRSKGKAGFPATRKKEIEKNLMNSSPISVLFLDNTKGGTLSRRFQEDDRVQGEDIGVSWDAAVKIATKHQSLGDIRLWKTGLHHLQPAG